MNQTAASVTITKEVTFNASAMRVFDALTDPAQRAKWWSGKWLIIGEYRITEPPSSLAFTMLSTWMPEPTETFVRFDLDEKAGVTKVRLTHSGLTAENVQYFRGWPEILAALQHEVDVAELMASVRFSRCKLISGIE